MDKSKLSLVIDGLMFLAIAAIGGLGFLMKWVLPPGPDRMAKYGRSVQISWLGMDRHQFGTIHLCIAFVLLGLLVLHIMLHWGQILAIYRRLVPKRESRRAVALLFSIACAALLAFPLFIRAEVADVGGPGPGRLREVGLSFPGTQETAGSVPAAAEAAGPLAVGTDGDPCANCAGCGCAADASAGGAQTQNEAGRHACPVHGPQGAGGQAQKGQAPGPAESGLSACEGCPGCG